MLLKFLPLMLFPIFALAGGDEVRLAIKDHRFEPATLKLPAGRKIKLLVENRDATAEEFESHDLNREKLIASGTSTAVFVGPLARGCYTFYGEFNPKTASGQIIVE